MSILRISLFGDMHITHDDGPAITNVTRTTQALLAYLLLRPHRPQPRDILADVFWGDRSQERARSSLKTALWELLRQPGSHLVGKTTTASRYMEAKEVCASILKA